MRKLFSLHALLVLAAVVFATQKAGAQSGSPLTLLPGNIVRCAAYAGKSIIITIALKNDGDSTLRVTSSRLNNEGDSVFQPYGSICNDLEAGEFTTLTFRFAPEKEGSYRARILLEYASSVRGTVEASLRGECVWNDIPLLRFDPAVLDPPPTVIGEEMLANISLRNIGAVGPRAASLRITGPDSPKFDFLRPLNPHVLPPSPSVGVLRCRSEKSGRSLAVLEAAYEDSLVEYAILTIPWIGRYAVLGTEDPQPFGDAMLGQSKTGLLALRSLGTVPLNIHRIEFVGDGAADYSHLSADSFSVHPGMLHWLSVLFTPSALGPRNAVLRLYSNDSSSAMREFLLTGNGVPYRMPDIALGSGFVTFGKPVFADSTAQARNIILNTGTAPLNVYKITTDMGNPLLCQCELRFQPPLPFIVPPGDSVELGIFFAPTSGYLCSSTVSVFSDAPAHREVRFRFEGLSLHAPVLAVTPHTLEFVADAVDDTVEASVTLENTGHAESELRIHSDTIVGPDAANFTLTESCPAGALIDAPRTLLLRYTQGGPGMRRAVLRLYTNDPARPTHDIPLSGRIAGTDATAGLRDPESWRLDHAPNPASAEAIVTWTAAHSGEGVLQLRDSHGRLLRSYHANGDAMGSHTQRIDLRGLPQGVYFYTLISGTRSLTRSLLLLR